MNLYVALCGNRYSEMLAKSFAIGRGGLIIHRSNVKPPLQKIKRVLLLLLVVVLRYTAIPLLGRELHLMIPHNSGSYRFVMWVLKPHYCILMDDGVTFEYWSQFHCENVLPILEGPKTYLLLGPRQPIWVDRVDRSLELFVITRRQLVGNILASDASSVNGVQEYDSKKRTGWVVDDGQFLPHQLDSLRKGLYEKFNCEDVLILWHPARRHRKDCSEVDQPAEVSIISSGRQTEVVVGRASTTLFNIKAYDPNIYVITIPSGYADLDESARGQGIELMEIN